MVKSKSKVITLIVSIILLASAFLLFGCEQGPTTEQIQENLNSFIQTENEANSFLSEDNTLKNFTMYKEAEQPETIDNNYQNLVMIAVDYIEDYARNFESEENFDYSLIQQNLDALNASYTQTLQDYQDFMQAQDASQIVYNGFALNYQNSVIDFVNDVFQTALSMKDCLAQNFGLIDDNFEEIVTVDQANIYLDAVRLELANDYRQFFLSSCKGEILAQNDIYAAVSNQLQSLADIRDILVTANRSPQFVTLKQKYDAIAEESAIMQTCLTNFSMYDFVNSFDGDINVYQTQVQDAENYLEKIESYFFNSQNQGALGNFILQISTLYA